MRNITAFFAGVLAIVLIAKAMGAEPEHLPPEVPTSSTAFVCSNDNGKNGLIVAIVFTYANGQVYRFDSDHMWGMTPKQAAQWSDASANSRIYFVPCEHGAIT